MDEREAKVAQNSKLFQRPGHANKNIGSTTIIYIQDQTRNTILISLSLSINRIALLFIWQANQYKGGKEPQEIQKRKNKEQGKREEREAEGNSKY